MKAYPDIDEDDPEEEDTPKPAKKPKAEKAPKHEQDLRKAGVLIVKAGKQIAVAENSARAVKKEFWDAMEDIRQALYLTGAMGVLKASPKIQDDLRAKMRGYGLPI
jgi:hypothetical protein